MEKKKKKKRDMLRNFLPAVLFLKQDMARGRPNGPGHSASVESNVSVVATVASSEQPHSPVLSSGKQQKPKSKAFEKLWSLDYQSGGGGGGGGAGSK